MFGSDQNILGDLRCNIFQRPPTLKS